MSSKLFPEERARELVQLVQAHPTHTPNREYCNIYYTLIENLLGKASYRDYSAEIKDDMKSRATWEWLKYGHTYNPERGRVFTFLTRNAENSFKFVLKTHYRHLNMDKNIVQLMEDNPELLISNIEDELDSEQD